MTMRAPFNPTAGANQVVTPAAAAARITIDPASKSVRLVNSGANICHVRITAAAGTATIADTPVLPNSDLIVSKGEGQGSLSYISAAGTTLHVQTGEGGI